MVSSFSFSMLLLALLYVATGQISSAGWLFPNLPVDTRKLLPYKR